MISIQIKNNQNKKMQISKAFNETILPTVLALGGAYFLLFYPKVSIIVVLLILTPFVIHGYVMIAIDFQKQLNNTSNPEKRELLKENFYMRVFISGGIFVFIYWICFSILDGGISLAPIYDYILKSLGYEYFKN